MGVGKIEAILSGGLFHLYSQYSNFMISRRSSHEFKPRNQYWDRHN
jgi:hypothetical protein